jgi:hypothetical protein
MSKVQLMVTDTYFETFEIAKDFFYFVWLEPRVKKSDTQL